MAIEIDYPLVYASSGETLFRNTGRAAAADNMWAAASDNLSACRRGHYCCVVILLQFSMTKKQKILRIERIFSGIL